MLLAFCILAFTAAAAIPVYAQPAPTAAAVDATAAVAAAPLDRTHVVLLISMALPLLALVLKRRKPLEHWIHASWAIGLSALLAGAIGAVAQVIAVHGLNAFAILSGVIVFLGTAASMASSTPADDEKKLQIPTNPALVLVLVALMWSGCGGQFQTTLREHTAADQQRAAAQRKAVQELRSPSCDPDCRDRNLGLIDALAAAVGP
jgi:hypothetical protein